MTVTCACFLTPNLVQCSYLGEGGSRVCGSRITTHVETTLAPLSFRKGRLLQGAFRLAEGRSVLRRRLMPIGVYSRASLEERFWAKVDVRGPGECWPWTGAKTTAGYGSLLVSLGPKRNGYAHRVSWELHYGPIPDGQHVCHVCDHPACVNPSHLFLGDAAANMQDKAVKGRAPRGVGIKNHKLTEAQVCEIRDRMHISQCEFARLFGVDQSTISYIRAGKTWKHIGRFSS